MLKCLGILDGDGDGFDTVTNRVDRLSRRMHFIKSNSADTEADVDNSFFDNILKSTIDYWTVLYHIVISSSDPSSEGD